MEGLDVHGHAMLAVAAVSHGDFASPHSAAYRPPIGSERRHRQSSVHRPSS
jgi:hypothetical protein